MGISPRLGVGEEIPNEAQPHIYTGGLVTVGERSRIPDDITVGKNTCIFGATGKEDYPEGHLAGGKTLIKAGDEQ